MDTLLTREEALPHGSARGTGQAARSFRRPLRPRRPGLWVWGDGRSSPPAGQLPARALHRRPLRRPEGCSRSPDGLRLPGTLSCLTRQHHKRAAGGRRVGPSARARPKPSQEPPRGRGWAGRGGQTAGPRSGTAGSEWGTRVPCSGREAEGELQLHVSRCDEANSAGQRRPLRRKRARKVRQGTENVGTGTGTGTGMGTRAEMGTGTGSGTGTGQQLGRGQGPHRTSATLREAAVGAAAAGRSRFPGRLRVAPESIPSPHQLPEASTAHGWPQHPAALARTSPDPRLCRAAPSPAAGRHTHAPEADSRCLLGMTR